MPTVITALGYVASAASVYSAVSSMNNDESSGAPAALAPPPIPLPTALPTPDATGNAKKASLIDQLRRRGRASTILSDTGLDKLGAG